MLFIEDNFEEIDNQHCSAFVMPHTITTKRLAMHRLGPNKYNALRIARLTAKNTQHLLPFFERFCAWDVPEKVMQELKKTHENDAKTDYFIFQNGQPIGYIGIIEYAQDRELQYWIDKDFEGHGYMNEAIKALEKEAFKANQKPLILLIEVGNNRSKNTAVKLGYQFRSIVSQQTEWIKTFEQFLKQEESRALLPVQQKKAALPACYKANQHTR